MAEFNPLSYLQGLHGKLKDTKDSYMFCRVSSTTHLEEVLNESRRANYFFAVDDSQEGNLFRGAGGTWFEKRPVVVYLLKKLNKWPDMDGRETAINTVRPVYRKLIGRINRDFTSGAVEGLEYFDPDDVPFFELPGFFAAGCAGIYFMFTIDMPVDLIHNADDWDE